MNCTREEVAAVVKVGGGQAAGPLDAGDEVEAGEAERGGFVHSVGEGVGQNALRGEDDAVGVAIYGREIIGPAYAVEPAETPNRVAVGGNDAGQEIGHAECIHRLDGAVPDLDQ